MDIAGFLFKDYIEKNKYASINFFRQSSKHYQVWLIILSYHYIKKELSLETIKKHSLHISLKTISSIVKDAEKQEYVQKQKSISDTRNKNILPTNQTVNEFEIWSKNLKCNINKLVK